MCELFGMSSNRPTELTASLSLFRKRGGETADHSDGWGIASLEKGAFRLYKEPDAAAGSKLLAELARTVRADLVLAHVRKAKHPRINNYHNTHPFLCNCCDREWVFAHNGLVPDVMERHLLEARCSSQPSGETDSEYAFHYLLEQIAGCFKPDVQPGEKSWFADLAALSELLASYGQFNFLMSDGVYLLAYGHDRLHWLERQCGDLKLVLLTTEPLTENESWRAFKAGELRIYRHGEFISHLQTQPRMAKPPVSPPQDAKAVIAK